MLPSPEAPSSPLLLSSLMPTALISPTPPQPELSLLITPTVPLPDRSNKPSSANGNSEMELPSRGMSSFTILPILLQIHLQFSHRGRVVDSDWEITPPRLSLR